MKPLKTIITIILFGAILAPVVVQFTGFVRLSRMYDSFEKRLEQEMTHTITLRASEVVWAKKDKEIWYHGRMFDIKETRFENGSFTFKGLFDDEEKDLKARVAQAAKHKKEAAAQNLSQIFTTGLFVQPLSEYKIATAFSVPCAPAKTGYLSSRYTSVITGSPGRPPWRTC